MPKKHTIPRVMSFVTSTAPETACPRLPSVCTGGPEGARLRTASFLFFGEIPNQPGHGVVYDIDARRFYVGVHVSDLRELSTEEV